MKKSKIWKVTWVATSVDDVGLEYFQADSYVEVETKWRKYCEKEGFSKKDGDFWIMPQLKGIVFVSEIVI